MKIDMMRIIVPPDIIGEGYRRVDTNTETWQDGDQWLRLSDGDWCQEDGEGWGRYVIRRKVEPRDRFVECEVRVAEGQGYYELLRCGNRCPLALASGHVGFGGYRYGDEWERTLRFDERGVVVKPDAVRFWEEG